MTVESLTTEEWRPVESYDGYLVSDQARVWSTKKNQLIRQAVKKHGYRTVQIRQNSISKQVFVHRLVAAAFCGGVGDQVRHLDGNPSNNLPSNLIWGTRAENMQDIKRHGRNPHLRKTHCPQGHAYDAENTIVRDLGDGRTGRKCRICDREGNRIRMTGVRQLRREAELRAILASPDDVRALQDTVIRQNRRIQAVLAFSDEMTGPWADRLRVALRDVSADGAAS